MRLGEILVHKKIITEEQLRTALEAQLIYGGHLGTLLIEMGYLDEELLGELLARALNVDHAPGSLFTDIPEHLIESIPAKLAARHQVVPLRLDDKVLRVAMVDPKNLQALDEIAFASGYTVQPSIAPEIRIAQAMERYYAIPRRVRYITVARDLGKTGAGAGTTPPVGTYAKEPRRDGFDELSDRLCLANTKEDAGRIALDHAGRTLARCILFKVKEGTAALWEFKGIRLPPAHEAGLAFDVTEEPLLKRLVGNPCFRGTVTDDKRYRRFYRALGMDLPEEALILPIHLHERVVGLFYGDMGPGEALHGDPEPYRRIVEKLAFALSMIIVKQKIRAA